VDGAGEVKLRSGFTLRDDLSIAPPGGPEHLAGALREGHDSYVDRPEVDGVERDWTPVERWEIAKNMIMQWVTWAKDGRL
jgi:hypothetical protein